MNGIKHHISDDLLMGYAAGALPQAFDLVVASHVSLSDDARARLAGFEELGGVVLSDMEEAELAEDSLEQTLARIAGTPVQKKPVQPSNGIFPNRCARSWAETRTP
jgi:putative transcriptional regulator